MKSKRSDFIEDPKIIEELINRRRRQILVHSAIYYRFSSSLVEDLTFDSWGLQLANLQTKYPQIASKCAYADDFKGFDGSSGFHLPHADPHIVSIAVMLLNNKK